MSMAVLRTDEVDLAYDDVGSGSPPLLLIHGFSCARSDFEPLIADFSGRHRVIAFDQRGHGESSLARDDRYGFTVDVEDALTLCAELGVERPIVVGHSLGGVTALQLAARPGFATALVLLDSTVELPGEVQGELETFLRDLTGATDEQYQERIRAYARYRMIDPSDDTELAHALVDRSAAIPKDVYVQGARSILDVDVPSTALAVTVPALFIASSLPWIDMARVHELLPRWYLGRTVGAGHFHHLLVPEQVNPMIQRFVDSLDAGFPAAAPSEW
jgi:pimeloyl-ACP methyl ester carboxylesterase